MSDANEAALHWWRGLNGPDDPGPQRAVFAQPPLGFTAVLLPDSATARTPTGHVNTEQVEILLRALLTALGCNPASAGLTNTPKRVAAWWTEFLDYDAGDVSTTFDSIETDQLVVVSGMRVWSICEHHLMPFYADVTVGYLAASKVLGLSKLARIAHKHAHRLQLQERLVQGIADEVAELASTADVAVVARGVHLCMVARGIKTNGTMTSSVMRGQFRADASTRAEFMRLALAEPITP